MFISKMVKINDQGRFIAFGRVFSGTVGSGTEVKIMGANYSPESKGEVYIKKVQSTVIFLGNKIQSISEVPAGNICGIVGIDNYLIKQGTIADPMCNYPIKTMKYSVSPVVRVAVEPKNPTDLPKLVAGLKALSQSDPIVQCITEPTGQHIIAGSGELHIEMCLSQLVR